MEVVEHERGLALLGELVHELAAEGDRRSRDAPTQLGRGGRLQSPEHALRAPRCTYDHSTTGSLSPSSRVSHATGLVASSDSRQAASSVDLPEPAGAATTVSLIPGPARSRSKRRSRTIVCVAPRRRVQLRHQQGRQPLTSPPCPLVPRNHHRLPTSLRSESYLETPGKWLHESEHCRVANHAPRFT